MIQKKDLFYHLPEKQIAKEPLENRDQSKLLVYKDGEIKHAFFHQIINYLPKDSNLIFNETKVVFVRLYFKRESGAKIEILLEKPVDGGFDTALINTQKSRWFAMIRNVKKWRDDEIILHLKMPSLKAKLINRSDNIVELSWQGNLTLGQILEDVGRVPLPPYINREDHENDKQNYQTIFAKNQGAIAAPTAGLHFTHNLKSSLLKNGLSMTNLTLHVGIGTFKPVENEDILQHNMHQEQFFIDKQALENLTTKQHHIPVGTTALRTLESLYILGSRKNINLNNIFIEQFERNEQQISFKSAIQNIISTIEKEGVSEMSGHTELMITPDYKIKSSKALITNFHLPSSTLLLIIHAIVGEKWKTIYQDALTNQYRFLSFGDSSLLFIEE